MKLKIGSLSKSLKTKVKRKGLSVEYASENFVFVGRKYSGFFWSWDEINLELKFQNVQIKVGKL